jgi:hypothetical protein
MVGATTTIAEPFAAARVASSCLCATRLVAEVAQASSFLIPPDTIAPEHVVLLLASYPLRLTRSGSLFELFELARDVLFYPVIIPHL